MQEKVWGRGWWEVWKREGWARRIWGGVLGGEGAREELTPPPRRTLGTYGDPRGVGVSYERGTPVFEAPLAPSTYRTPISSFRHVTSPPCSRFFGAATLTLMYLHMHTFTTIPASPLYTSLNPLSNHQHTACRASLPSLLLRHRGTSLKRKRTPLGPYRRPMPRVLGGS